MQDTDPDSPEKKSHKTIFESLLGSDLPPQEKTVDRLKEEGYVILLAGSDTVAETLTVLSYHLLANSEILRRLKRELTEAIPDPEVHPSWQMLQSLPLLVSSSTQNWLIAHTR